MDALTPVAFIAFLAQFIMWLGLPDRSVTETEFVAEPEAMAA
jgi:hypothetical protein